MTTLNGLLSSGQNALALQRLAMSITGNNIANATTPGYVRQRLDISPDIALRLPGGFALGTGARAEGVSRSFDHMTWGRLVQEESRASYYRAQAQPLSSLEVRYNESDRAGVSQAIADLFSSFQDVANAPDSSAERRTALSAADTLARRVNELASALTQTRTDLDSSLENSVTSINEAAVEIARLNSEIAAAEANGGSAANLRDRREELIRSVAQEANISFHAMDTGAINIYLANRALVEGDRANQLEVASDPDRNGLLAVHLGSGENSQDITDQISGGTLGGVLALRDSIIPGYQEDLDTLAFQLASSINAQHAQGYGLDGIGGRNLFEPIEDVQGAASRLALSEDVAGNPDAFAASSTPDALPGNGDNAILLFELSDAPEVEGGKTFSEHFREQVERLGDDAGGIQREADAQESILQSLGQLQESISGVNVDEEATNLIKFQNAYQASARFISTVQDMMQVLMRI